MIDLDSLEEYDKLSDDLKELFRKYDIEFYAPAWRQCYYLADSDKEAFQMFKNLYYKL